MLRPEQLHRNSEVKAVAAGEEWTAITGHVIYASTPPFDDPAMSLQLQWEHGVPRVKLNLPEDDRRDSETSSSGSSTR